MSGALSRPGPSSIKQGGGINFLCLPIKPLYSQYSYGRSERRTYIDNVIYGKSFVGFENKIVSCSVCEVGGKTDIVMIPGKHECESEWTIEYTGYIATNGKKNERSEYVCIDQIKSKPAISRHMRIYIASLDLVSFICDYKNIFCGKNNHGSSIILPCVVCSR